MHGPWNTAVQISLVCSLTADYECAGVSLDLTRREVEARSIEYHFGYSMAKVTNRLYLLFSRICTKGPLQIQRLLTDSEIVPPDPWWLKWCTIQASRGSSRDRLSDLHSIYFPDSASQSENSVERGGMQSL